MKNFSHIVFLVRLITKLEKEPLVFGRGTFGGRGGRSHDQRQLQGFMTAAVIKDDVNHFSRENTEERQTLIFTVAFFSQ